MPDQPHTSAVLHMFLAHQLERKFSTGVGMKDSSSKAIENARQVVLDSWHKHGSNIPDQALQNDNSSVRKPIDPKSLRPKD